MPPQEHSNTADVGAKSAYTNEAFDDGEPHKTAPSPSIVDGEAIDSPPLSDDQLFEFDHLLPHVGEFGVYQKRLFLLMVPFTFFVAWVYFSQIFITITPERYWCYVPELANYSVSERKQLAIPQGVDGFEHCRMYQTDFHAARKNGIQTGDPSWPTVPCSHGWEYDYSDVPYISISTENHWVCDEATLPSIATSIFFCGAIIGGLLFGWIADRFGRIPALVGANLMGCTGGIATAFCGSFWSFCVCRFLVGMAFDNCFTMMYILVLEYVGPRWRTFVANMSIAIFFTIASVLLPWIAYYLADWRLLCIVTSAPLIIAVASPWLLPESARWLVSQGRFDEAIQILKTFEKTNKTHVDDEVYNTFKINCIKSQKEEQLEATYTVIDLFRTPQLRKMTVLLIAMWMAISLVFDGHVRNVGSLGLDIFVTFTIACATEFPADTFLTLVLDVWGRRWLAFATMVFGGVFSLLATAVPYGIPSATLAICGRFAVNISYNIGLQYAAELLPTVVRAQGVALIHIMGYVASIIAPFVVYLGNVSNILPLIILGILGVVGGMLALFLPETLGQELPQTLNDGENFGLDQTFWTFPCLPQSNATKKAAAIKAFQNQGRRRSSIRASYRGEIKSSIINRGSFNLQTVKMPSNENKLSI